MDAIRQKQPVTIKRSMGYGDVDEDVRETSKGLKRMRIDEAQPQ